MLKLISRNLFIQSKTTPNPNFLKFIPTGKIVMEIGTKDFSSIRESFVSPLAKNLFSIDGISRVFYGKDYISVGKKDDFEWNNLKAPIYEIISDHFDNNIELFSEEINLNSKNMIQDDDTEAIILIKEILETRIKPVVQEDGGDIDFYDFDEKTGLLLLVMKGSCTECPSSSVTLKNGVERMITYYVEEVKTVEAINFKED